MVPSKTNVVPMNFVCVWSYFAINEVNRDMEDPWLYDPNDLPLSTLQADLNLRLDTLDPSRRARRLLAAKGASSVVTTLRESSHPAFANLSNEANIAAAEAKNVPKEVGVWV